MKRKTPHDYRGAGAAFRAALHVLDPTQFEAENHRRLSGPGFRAFLTIADRWGLTERERLMVVGVSEQSLLDDWTARARERRDLILSVDVLLRISGVLGIHKNLTTLFSHEEGVAWLRGPHNAPEFGGRLPIDFLTDGTLDGILLVRRYLDDFLRRIST